MKTGGLGFPGTEEKKFRELFGTSRFPGSKSVISFLKLPDPEVYFRTGAEVELQFRVGIQEEIARMISTPKVFKLLSKMSSRVPTNHCVIHCCVTNSIFVRKLLELQNVFSELHFS